VSDLWARRDLFDDDHEAFRDSVRGFVRRHVTGHVQEWDDAGIVPRDLWHAAGQQGLLGLNVPEEHGGGGVTDYRFRVAMIEELAKVNAASVAAGFSVHTDIVQPYVVDLATPEQAQRWLPRLASGASIGAIAMTEPGAGSDLRGVRATARREGDTWVLSGQKTFITNGIRADVVIVAARTQEDGTDGSAGRNSGEGTGAGTAPFSLFVVEEGTPGFSRGRKLDKVGLRSQDTAELVFEDVRLSDDDILGGAGQGLHHLMSHLPLERLGIAVNACAGARAALTWTLDHVQQREAFGRPLSALQHTQFALAEMVTELEVTQAYVDAAVLRLNRDALTAVDAAKAKWWATEMHQRTVSRCVQLFGGYGYMLEYPIARAYTDVRVTTIYGGATEIMKTLVARDLLMPGRQER